MQILSSSDGFLKLHFQTPTSWSFKPFSFSRSYELSDSSQKLWKRSNSNSCISKLRYANKLSQYKGMTKELIQNFPQIFSHKSSGTGTDIIVDGKGAKVTLNSTKKQNNNCQGDISSDIDKENEGCISVSIRQNAHQASFVPFYNLMKVALPFGLLYFQVSQIALASSDVAINWPSISLLGDLGDISQGFASALLLIFFSELGDKTFFIAALLAARNPGIVVFTGTFGALAIMTFLSVILGRTFHYVDGILPFRFGEADLPIDDIAAVCLLVYFGVSTLLDAASGDGLKAEEEQKEAELAVSEVSVNGAGIVAAANTVISTFLVVFVAEWGDKSFFSTIALAAAASPLGVIGGALAGHAAATLLAVVGGSILGTFLSEKVVAYVGGVLFLVFAVSTLIEIVN